MKHWTFRIIVPAALAIGLGVPCAPAAAPLEQSASAGNSKADVQLAAQIRRALVKDNSLSIEAHNVTVDVKDGIVTLRGQVPSGEQRDAIVQVARRFAGDRNVVDTMAVAPPK